MTTRRASGDQVRATVWFWPLLGVVAALAVTLALLGVRPDPRSTFAE